MIAAANNQTSQLLKKVHLDINEEFKRCTCVYSKFFEKDNKIGCYCSPKGPQPLRPFCGERDIVTFPLVDNNINKKCTCTQSWFKYQLNCICQDDDQSKSRKKRDTIDKFLDPALEKVLKEIEESETYETSGLTYIIHVDDDFKNCSCLYDNERTVVVCHCFKDGDQVFNIKVTTRDGTMNYGHFKDGLRKNETGNF